MSRCREDAIRVISDLFPADSPKFSVRCAGLDLLEQAQRQVSDWRNEPTNVLQRYAELCEEEELRLAREAARTAERGV